MRSLLRIRPLSLAVAALAAVVACGDSPSGTILIVTGEETDTFSRNPAPTTLVAEEVALDGARHELGRTALPADELGLGDKPRGDVGAIVVAAYDPLGKALLRGESLFVQWGALEGSPLEVFVQRTGELARMPRPPSAFDAKAITIALGRYILAADGSTTMLYDLLGLRPLAGAPAFPRPAKSLAAFESVAVVIDEQGATTFDLPDAHGSDLSAPTGGTFAEVAGGTTILGASGASYVVGATRFGTPTTKILSLSKDGIASFASLTTPREGACAAWVEGRGLVIVGGSAGGAGAELLTPGSNQAAPLPFPADPVHGCAAAALDGSHILVAGGTNGPTQPRLFDFACAGACTPVAWPGTIALGRSEAFALSKDAAIFAGDDAAGATHAYRVSATVTVEIPLKVPRRGARLIALPSGASGAAAIVGGGAPGIEQYRE